MELEVSEEGSTQAQFRSTVLGLGIVGSIIIDCFESAGQILSANHSSTLEYDKPAHRRTAAAPINYGGVTVKSVDWLPFSL